jgi:hypothetical protein
MYESYLTGTGLEALTISDKDLPLFIKLCELSDGDRQVVLSLICRFVCCCK